MEAKNNSDSTDHPILESQASTAVASSSSGENKNESKYEIPCPSTEADQVLEEVPRDDNEISEEKSSEQDDLDLDTDGGEDDDEETYMDISLSLFFSSEEETEPIPLVEESEEKLAAVKKELTKLDGFTTTTTTSEAKFDVSVEETEFRKFATERILKEIKEIEDSCPPGINAVPTDDDIFLWTTLIAAPDDSPYEGGVFEGIIQFTSEYPWIPPSLTFTSRIFHPNISYSGEVCLQELHKYWKPRYTLGSFLATVQYLLADPSCDDAANIAAAEMFHFERSNYLRIAREYVDQQLKASELSQCQEDVILKGFSGSGPELVRMDDKEQRALRMHSEKLPKTEDKSGLSPDPRPKETYPELKPIEILDPKSEETVDLKPDVILDPNADETLDLMPEETSDLQPEEIFYLKPDEILDPNTAETLDVMPEETSEFMPEETSEFMSEETSDLKPEETYDLMPEETVDLKPEENPDIKPAQTLDPQLEVTPEA